MISYGLIIAICLVMAVGIVGAAIVWALLEIRRHGGHHQKHRLSSHLKSHKPPSRPRHRRG